MSKSNNALIEQKNNTDLNEDTIEKQEHLTEERFNKLKPLNEWMKFNDRPSANLIDLMHWAKANLTRLHAPFNGTLVNKSNLQCYIHNKIVIDGSFLQFCEEQGIKVECLLRDSVASWKTEHDSEHFMMQGIFKITKGDVDFVHCALFHKGNQNEDEVSFFVIVDDSVFSRYVDIRNSYDKWLVARDRDHLEVHVVGGDGYPYKRDLSWDDVFLEENLKLDIRNFVEGFLKSKDIYKKMNVGWKTGCLLYGEPGNGKTSLIKTIISNYNFKPVTVQSGTQTNDDTITEAFEYASSQEPALLYIEDLDTLLGQTISLSHFLNMIDGVNSHNGLMVIATSNDLSKLKESVTDRPSRFDRKWEIPLPNEEISLKYLNKWFGNILKPAEYKKIVAKTVEHNFSFAYLKELYVGSVYNALADGREVPNLKDVNVTQKRMLKDKENVKNGFEISTNGGDMGFA